MHAHAAKGASRLPCAHTCRVKGFGAGGLGWIADCLCHLLAARGPFSERENNDGYHEVDDLAGRGRRRFRMLGGAYRCGVNDVEQLPVRWPFTTVTDTFTL
jgi:hypothetical protein